MEERRTANNLISNQPSYLAVQVIIISFHSTRTNFYLSLIAVLQCFNIGNNANAAQKDSLRWCNQHTNSEDEVHRIEVYKARRRERYRNEALQVWKEGRPVVTCIGITSLAPCVPVYHYTDPNRIPDIHATKSSYTLYTPISSAPRVTTISC